MTYNPNTDAQRVARFVQFAREMGTDFNNEYALENAAKAYFNFDERLTDSAMEGFAKHTLPAPTTDNLIYKDGPFTWRTDEIILDVTNGGSPLMQWLPFEPLENREESVTHMSYVAAAGYQPTQQSYADYLDELSVGDECDRECITAEWGSFEYTMMYGKACAASRTLTLDDFGMRQHKKTPIPRIRGPRAGYNLENDALWAIGQSGIVLEQHLDWNLLYGIHGRNHQWDGIRQLLTPGYIDSHLVGSGAPLWANPIQLDGTNITTCEGLAEAVKNLVRYLRKEIQDRNWRVGLTDMVIVMPTTFVNYIMDCIACGAMTGCGTQPTGYTIADWRAERARLMRGGVGYGILEIDGVPIPILPLNGIAQDGVDDEGNFVTTGDIMVLTRRVNGINCLATQLLDYTSLNGWDLYKRAVGENVWTANGGHFMHRWHEINKTCVKYSTEVTGRNVLRMAPLQAILSSVTIFTTLPNMSTHTNPTFGEGFSPFQGDPDGLLIPS